MSSGKKSFLLHIDSLDILDELTSDQAGMLFKAISAHQKGEEIELDAFVRIAFSPFKNQFIRDDEKYDLTCKRRAEAGSKGGKQKVANASNCKQEVANVADKKNKNKNKTNNDNELNTLDQSTIDHEVYEFCFNQFWESGIRKVGKKKAKPLFIKILKKLCGGDWQGAFDISKGLEKNIKARLEVNQMGFAEMHPTTYLNGERWADEITGVSNGTRQQHNQSHSDRQHEIAQDMLSKMDSRDGESDGGLIC